MQRLGILFRPGMAPQIRFCFWKPAPNAYIKINCDGASIGNPGNAGWGAVIRNSKCDILFTISVSIGVATNFLAECLAILEAVEFAVDKGMNLIWVESDSMAASLNFQKNKPPWQLRGRWAVCRNRALNIIISHTLREANFAADTAAKHASLLPPLTREINIGTPPWLLTWEIPNTSYTRLD
ncbi:ribonuclease H [Ranunculus cassubicifolius]